MAEAVDKLGMDVPDLIFDEDAVDAAAWFTARGWTAEGDSARPTARPATAAPSTTACRSRARSGSPRAKR